jgi:hypothetical protein
VDNGSTARPALRWVRALILAAVALTIGGVAHVTADGLLPGPLGLFGLLALSTGGVAPLLGRQASTRRVVLLLMLWQAVMHGALTALAGHAGDSVHPDHGAAASAHGGHVHSTAPTWVQHLLADMTGPNMAMVLAHLAAAAAVGWWLAAGERALWTLLALATRPVIAALAAVLLSTLWLVTAATAGKARGAVTAPVAADIRPPAALFLSRFVTRRGPPGCLSA